MALKSRASILLPTLVGLGCVFTFPACKRPPDAIDRSVAPEIAEGLEIAPLAPRQAAAGPMFARLQPLESGIELKQTINATHPLNFLYVGGFMCGGVAIGDVDGDGRPDVFFVVNDGENRLYRQSGDWRFEDISLASGIGGGADAWGAGAAMVDIDGDGDLDIYVCNYDRANQLFVNEGKEGAGSPRFVERASEFGLNVSDACLMPYFCDYDRDGDLDVYIVCYRFYQPGGMPKGEVYEVIDGKPVLKPGFEKYYRMMEYAEGKLLAVSDGRRDYLLRNEGSGQDGRTTFKDVTEQAGIFGTGFGLSASWWDYNGDGFDDLYVANDFESADRLYQNNRDGTFSEIIQSAIPHTAWYSMGSATGDINNDGRLDLVVLDMAGSSHYKQKINMGEMSFVQQLVSNLSEPRQMMRNAVYLNTGVGRMLEVGYLAGIAKTDWSWAPMLADFDNDGQIDLFVTNGMSRNFMHSDVRSGRTEPVGKTEWDAFADTPTNPEQNFAFRNQGGLRFEDVSAAWGLDHVGISAGGAYGDLDGDGDVDLVVANLEEGASIYRNQSSDGHRAVFRLRGAGANTAALGAKLRIETSRGLQMRVLHPMTGFLGCNQAEIPFGLGAEQRIRKLTVTWADGGIDEFTDLPADQLITIEQSRDAQRPASVPAAKATRFRGGMLEGIAPHAETPFDDFAYQPLLPNIYSRLGPGIAWGDVDGDGMDEVFVGGAAGQPGHLYRKNPDHSFTEIPNPLAADAASEDMAALFFDADGDGDLDLFVVSGSYEIPAGDPAQTDRLYLNDGAGRFERAAGAIPDLRACGSVAAACDFDRDGDLDLFVGSRLIPRQFPLAPDSQLLVNEGGKFSNRTADLAPALHQSGLVTSAVWSDVDGDGWSDLLFTHEWGPVKVLRNTGGKLVDQTEAAGLASLLGWWNSIVSGDLDGDGDMDFVIGNVGLNTKYKASPEKPAQLYYGDFEGRGTMHLIEAEFEGDALFPVRGKSCSTRAMPFLKEKFGTFESFAKSGLSDIYTGQSLSNAFQFQVTELRSGVLRNDGGGRFEFVPLPPIAQIAPCFGAVITELSGDENPDLYVVQNSYSPQLETGRFDGGVSQLMFGNGDGTFTSVEAAESGLVVVGDAKSLTVTDLDGDRRPDFVVAVNNGRVLAFAHAGAARPGILQVTLRGAVDNPHAVGSRVTLHGRDGHRQTAEVCAGGGYLSQSSPAVYFGLDASAGAESITVRWPDGTESSHPFEDAWREGGALIKRRGGSK